MTQTHPSLPLFSPCPSSLLLLLLLHPLFLSSHISKQKSPLKQTKNARHNPNLLPSPLGRQPGAPDLRLEQASRARSTDAQETERPARELGAEGVEADDEEGAVAAGWSCCCVRESICTCHTLWSWSEIAGWADDGFRVENGGLS
jgi:hypothetical protein